MKKLLLIVLLSSSIIGCNKEKSLTTEKAQSENQSLTRGYSSTPEGYNYILANVSNPRANATAPARNDEMAWIWSSNIPAYPSKEVAWEIRILDNNYVRFWAQNQGFWERHRVMGINWARPNADKSTNAVLRVPYNKDLNIQWQLLGSRNYKPGQVDFWQGVIINRYNGQMLELANDYVENGTVYEYAVVRKPYRGSEEEKYYNKHGNFDRYPKMRTSTTIWYIHKGTVLD